MAHALKVLITNVCMHGRSETELCVFDLACGLLRRGHTPIVYSPVQGGGGPRSASPRRSAGAASHGLDRVKPMLKLGLTLSRTEANLPRPHHPPLVKPTLMDPTTDPRAALDDPVTHPWRPRIFSGRVIFDHQQKTGGMAVNRWLRTALGEGCASPNLVMIDHRSLIARYGGAYSVLTAHLTFDRQGLDPRYQYVTLLREPVDRMVSWFHYVVTNYTAAYFGAGWHDAKRFLDSDGAECSDKLQWNMYVRHFAAIEGVQSADDRHMLDAALRAVDRYDVWGLYEAMPEFVSDFAALIGIPAPENLARVNGTAQRPTMSDLRDGLRGRLTEFNRLDLEFYAILKDRYAEARRHRSRTSAVATAWEPLHAPAPLTRAGHGLTLHSARIVGGESRDQNNLLEFIACFSLACPVENLVIHATISDELGSQVFSTNTTLLDRPIGKAAVGTFQARCTILANLPTGGYSVGFQFSESLAGRSRHLGTFDGLAVFWIGHTHRASGPATFQLPATIDCVAVDGSAIAKVWRLGATDPSLSSHVGKIDGASVVSDGRAGYLLFGPYRSVIAGRWRAAVEGSFQPGAGDVRIDVASGSGRLVHAALELTAPTEKVELDFQLDHPVHDLEIRVWIHEFSSARIEAIAIQEAVASEADVGVATADCYGSNDIPLQGDEYDGLAESRNASVRATPVAADPAET
ncbi:MAG: hypothetical protein WCJ18_08780, partial [Planctomycetota bacterium]